MSGVELAGRAAFRMASAESSMLIITIHEIREIGVDFTFTLHEDTPLFMHLNPEFIYLMH